MGSSPTLFATCGECKIRFSSAAYNIGVMLLSLLLLRTRRIKSRPAATGLLLTLRQLDLAETASGYATQSRKLAVSARRPVGSTPTPVATAPSARNPLFPERGDSDDFPGVALLGIHSGIVHR